MEWTPAQVRVFREMGLCLSQDEFAAELGFMKRAVGNAECGAPPAEPGAAPWTGHALEKASDAQRDRFLAALAAG